MDSDFISQAETKIKDLISQLGWTYEYFQKNADAETFAQCPNSSSHRMPSQKLAEHLEQCNWVTEGYSVDELPLSISSENASSVVLTPELQKEIINMAAAKDPSFKIDMVAGSSALRPVPKTSTRYQQLFTQDERLALYDYVVSQTYNPTQVPEVSLNQPQPVEEKRDLTELELAAAERDAKRRRMSYRNKVHTNRKTHVEIMREVIETQMNCLVDEVPKEEDHETKAREIYYEQDDRSRSHHSRERSHHYSHKDDQHYDRRRASHWSQDDRSRSRDYRSDRGHSSSRYQKRKRHDDDEERDQKLELSHFENERLRSTINPTKDEVFEIKKELDEYLKKSDSGHKKRTKVKKSSKKHKKSSSHKEKKKHKKKSKKHKKRKSSSSDSSTSSSE